MKLRNLFMAVIAGAAMLVGCNKEVDLGPAKLDVSKDVVSFEAAEASQEITFTATRDWVLSGMPNWIAVNAESGVGSSTPQKLVIDVIENKEFNRQASLVITIGYARKVITVNQAGPEGEKPEGTGTMADPYTVAGVIGYLKDLGADVNSPKKVFVKGKVSALASKESDQFGAEGNSYGSGSFNISDDGSLTAAQFTAYRIYYLGNKKFASGDTPVKVGDEVVIYGNVVNFKGNTPETQQNQAFLYSLNGENRGGVEEEPGDDGEEVPDESLEPAGDTNIAGLVAKISKDSNSTNKSTYDGITLSGATVTYVNGGTVYLEDKSGAVLLYKNDHGFVAGDVISGAVSGEGYYFNGLPEIISLGEAFTKTSGTAPAPTEMTIEKLLSTYTSQLSRYIILKNVTVTTGMDGRKAVVSQGEKSVNVYAALKEGLNLVKDATGDIIVFPTLYNTTKQVSFWDNSHFTGNGGGSEPGPVEPGTNDGLTPASAFTASEAAAWVMANLEDKAVTETKYYVKGTIQRFYQKDNVDQNFTNNSNKQASFFITDDGKENTAGEFEAFQINYLNGATFDPAKDTDVKVGDVVVIYGTLKRWKTTAETDGNGAAYLYSLNAEGGDTPGGDTELGVMDSNVTFGAGTNGYIDNKINVTYNGTKYSEVANVKMGKSSAYGDGTLTIPAGTIKLNYFATGWKGADASVKFTIDGKEYTVDVKANDGATGTGTLELTVSDDDKYSITLPAALAAETKAKVETYSGSKTGYRAFVFAVHALAGEGGDEPGGDDPEQPKLPVNDGLTEATAFTVEDAIYVAKNGTEDKEYYVKAVVGKDISIKNGVASFELVDGTTDGKLTVVKAKSFKGEDFANDAPIEWLDEVILKGKVTEYSTLPALVDGQLVKWNGLPVFEAQFKTIAELNALCTATAAEYVGTLENAVVSFVPSPSNAIIKDATGSILLYKKEGHGLKQGQTFSGLVTVTALMYNGNYTELTAIDAAFTGDEAAVEPQTVTLATLAEDGYDKWQNAYVTIKNMEVTAVDKQNVSVKGSNWIMFSNAGNATCAVGDMITVTGTVTKYKSTLEVKAWTMDDIVKVEPAFSTVAELNAACTATAQELVGKLTDAVVSFVPDNKNAVIKDATGSILLYKKEGHGLKQGQTYSGLVNVTALVYNGNYTELTAIDAAFIGDEAAVAPEALSLATLAADFTKYQNAYVVVENLEVTAVSGQNINVKDGENTYVVYNAGNATCKAGDIIKATGTVTMYKNNAQIKAWTKDAIEVTKEAPAEETPATAITLSFASITTAKNGYTETWVQTCGDYSWTLANFNNNSGGWTYVRCGRKNNASVATITTNAVFTQAITNVVVTYDSYKAAKVNSTKLYVASDAEFTQNVQTVSGSVTGPGAYKYTITTPTANMYYKLEVDCASDSSNGFVQISKVVYNY